MTDRAEIIKRVEQVESLDIRRDGEDRQYVYDALTGQMGVVATQLAKDVRELLEENADQKAEIRRHHRDFSAWEGLADKGAQRLEENKRLREENEELRRRGDQSIQAHSETASDWVKLRDDLQKLIEALRPFVEPGGLSAYDAATHRTATRNLLSEIESRNGTD